MMHKNIRPSPKTKTMVQRTPRLQNLVTTESGSTRLTHELIIFIIMQKTTDYKLSMR